MLPGGTSQEIVQLNIESLWSGGPFQDLVRVTICERSAASNLFRRNLNALTVSHSRTMGEIFCLPNRPEWLKICRASAKLYFPVLKGQLTVRSNFFVWPYSSNHPVIKTLIAS